MADFSLQKDYYFCYSPSMLYNERLLQDDVVRYLQSNEKDPAEAKIGVEIEHFVTRASDGKTVTYFDDDGVGRLLQELCADTRKNRQLHYHDGNPLSVTREIPSGTQLITLEPGAQLEFSTSPRGTVREIEREYTEFLREAVPILRAKGQKLETRGYQPVTLAREIPFIPKKKYHYMADYFLDKGKLAHNMMKGTAATHVTIDYCNERDFAEKVRVGSVLSPVLAVLFSNCPVFEGVLYTGYAVRTQIWDNCDAHRCGLLPGIFDDSFGYREFASWFLHFKPVVFFRNGDYQFTGERELCSLLGEEGLRFGDKDYPLVIGEALRMVFTDVRVKQFLELRMTDALPPEKLLQYAALVYEIFYNRVIFERIKEYLWQFTERDLMLTRKEAPEKGPRAAMGEETIEAVTNTLLDIVQEYHRRENSTYLQPLFAELTKGPERQQCGTP